MKPCVKCGLVKPFTDFHRNVTRPDGYQIYCKPCRRAYDHEYYERTQQRLDPKRRERNRAYDRARLEWMQSLKLGPCTDCGRSYPPPAMQWDHLPGTVKLGNLSTEFRGRSRDEVLAEIAKCELVCANCHTLRTYRRSGLTSMVFEAAYPYSASY